MPHAHSTVLRASIVHVNSRSIVYGERPVGSDAAVAAAWMLPRPQSGSGPVYVSAGRCEKTATAGGGEVGGGGGGDGGGNEGGGKYGL